MRQKFLAHADASITDNESKRRLPVIAWTLFDHETDRPALRCKFDRVAENVDHHLLELHGVANIGIVHLPGNTAIVDKTFVPALTADDRVDLL